MSANYVGSRQMKLECLKQAVIATGTMAKTADQRDVEVMRIAKIMFEWVMETPKEEEGET